MTRWASMPEAVKAHIKSGHHIWGVLVVGPQAAVGHTLEELALVYEASDDSEWLDVYFYLPLGR